MATQTKNAATGSVTSGAQTASQHSRRPLNVVSGLLILCTFLLLPTTVGTGAWAASPKPEATQSAAEVLTTPLPETAEPDIQEPDPEPPPPEPEISEPDVPKPSAEASADVGPLPSVEPSPPASVTPTPETSETPTSEPDQPAPAPASAPAWQDSPVSTQSVLIAVSVLIAAVLLLLASSRFRRAPKSLPGATAEAPPIAPVEADTSRFLVLLGEAMIDAGDPVTDVTTTLERVAHRNGVPDAEIVVFATALMVSLPGREQVNTAVSSAGVRGLRMDQIDEVFDVVNDAQTTNLRPAEGVRRLEVIRSSPAPWGTAARITGYATMSAGLSLILGASAAEIAVAAILGSVIGALQLYGGGLTSTYRSALPLVSAFAVSTAVFLLARTDLDIGAFAPLIAPLVGLLPGALLTTGVLELATGQMISGAGRLAAGIMRLFLLALGIVAAAQLVGVPAGSVTDVAADPLDTWAPWIGVAIFGLGIVVHMCARTRATPWILLVLYVAYAGQVIGGLFLGGVLSAFTGAVLMTPVAILVARHRSGPTPLVSFLPAFWLLVPGALGLVGVTKYIGDARIYGADSLLTTAETMVAIALGVLVGTSFAGRLTRRRGFAAVGGQRVPG